MFRGLVWHRLCARMFGDGWNAAFNVASDIVDPPYPDDCGKAASETVFRQKLDKELREAQKRGAK